MEGILAFAVPIITLKPVFAGFVPLIPVVQECSAPEAKTANRGKKKAASVSPANFSGNSDLKGTTSVRRKKNRSTQKKQVFL